jgi:hypothetical protein
MYRCCEYCGYNFLLIYQTEKGVLLCYKHYQAYQKGELDGSHAN